MFHKFMGNGTEVLLMAGNMGTLMLTIQTKLIGGLQLAALAIGTLASLALLINECMKIFWKVKQRKVRRAEERIQTHKDDGGKQ